MKKAVSICCLLALLCTLCPTAVPAQEEGRGGIPAFFVGCCLGIREGTEYNEGKDLHWREWVPVAIGIGGMPVSILAQGIPLIGQLVSLAIGGAALGAMVWNGVTCATGTTAHEFAEQYGTNWY